MPPRFPLKISYIKMFSPQILNICIRCYIMAQNLSSLQLFSQSSLFYFIHYYPFFPLNKSPFIFLILTTLKVIRAFFLPPSSTKILSASKQIALIKKVISLKEVSYTESFIADNFTGHRSSPHYVMILFPYTWKLITDECIR